MSEAVFQEFVVKSLRELFQDKILVVAHFEGVNLTGCKDKYKITRAMDNAGRIKGVPDLMVFTQTKEVLSFELKVGSNGQSKEQIQIEAQLESYGFNYYVIRDIYTAVNLILKSLNLDIEYIKQSKVKGKEFLLSGLIKLI
jgi:hypothetical protein